MFNKLIFHKHFVIYSMLSSIIIRIIWIILFQARPIDDFLWYYEHGINIAHGDGYTTYGVLTARWSIEYPGFLGIIFYLFDSSILVAQIANIILYTGVILCAFYCSKILFHSEYAARITLLLLICYPNHIAYSSLIATEIFFTSLLMLGSLVLFISKNRISYLILSGFFLV